MADFNLNWNQQQPQAPQMQMQNYGMGGNAMNQQQLNFNPMEQQSQGVMGQMGNWWNGARGEGGFLSNQSLFGGTDANGMQQQGSFLPMIQAMGSLGQGYLGMQQLNLAQDQFAFNKETFAKNWANQTKLTNDALYNNEVRRRSVTGEQAVSKDDYLAKEGVK